MSFASRLKKMEQMVHARGVESLRRPDDVSEEIWQRAMGLLADYSPAMLHRWQSLDFMLAWCGRVQPLELEAIRKVLSAIRAIEARRASEGVAFRAPGHTPSLARRASMPFCGRKLSG